MSQRPTSFSVTFLPDRSTVRAKKGTTVFQALEAAGFSIHVECGGDGRCGQCKVQIVKGTVQPQLHPLLTSEDAQHKVQLACLTEIHDNLEVLVPEELRLESYQIHSNGNSTSNSQFVKELIPFPFTHRPLSEVISVTVPPPTLENNADDLERMAVQLRALPGISNVYCPLLLLRTLPHLIREHHGVIHLSLTRSAGTAELIHISTKESEHRNCGVAVDIGTTTIAVQLIDLNDGRILAEKTEYNSQMTYGADIINRIIFALKPGGLEKLQQKVVSTINALIDELRTGCSVEKETICACAIAGNTTMQHLFLGITPRYIREEPYVPAVLQIPGYRADEARLAINPNAPVYCTPGIGSYVGGDITAGILKSGMHRSRELTLYVDLGTNGEIVLGNSEWMTACACSAGPAFEGSGITCGMRAASGAIENIQIDPHSGDVRCRVINGTKPRGICGSALIDLPGDLYCANIIDQKGQFITHSGSSRVRKKGRHYEYVLVEAVDTVTGEDIVITARDIENLIRTKGAIWAGISTLLKALDIHPSSIDRIIIAGTFGNHINVENAILIGMLPDVPVEKFTFIGNGSLHGAALTLLSEEMREELTDITGKITNFELSATQGYMDEFIASLFIPHTHVELFPSFLAKRRRVEQ